MFATNEGEEGCLQKNDRLANHSAAVTTFLYPRTAIAYVTTASWTYVWTCFGAPPSCRVSVDRQQWFGHRNDPWFNTDGRPVDKSTHPRPVDRVQAPNHFKTFNNEIQDLQHQSITQHNAIRQKRFNFSLNSHYW